nr:ribonuclease H-like domain-containing protein [Tanacetum cinerariifolium]
MDRLPARFNLDIYKVDINSLRCLAYDGAIETLQHIFIECHVVVALWKMFSAQWDVSCLVLASVWLRNQCHKGLQAFGWLFGVCVLLAEIVPSEGKLFRVCFCVSEKPVSKGRLYFAAVVFAVIWLVVWGWSRCGEESGITKVGFSFLATICGVVFVMQCLKVRFVFCWLGLCILKISSERERKARTTLLMAILEDNLAKFHKITDAKEMWEAIKSKFGGNDKSKKMQKYILKQQFEGFSVSNSEELHKVYDRFQSLMSQLEIHGADVSTEDVNQKFLRSLPSSWSQVSLITRTKPRVDTLSFDDLYNNIRVFESDVKGSTASSSCTQNVAFVSSDRTNSTNEVSSAYGVSTSSGHNSQMEGSSSYTDDLMYSFFANQSSCPQLDYEDLEQVDEFDQEEMDLKWQVAMIFTRLKRFYKKTGRKLHFDAKEPVGFDKTKVECFNCHNIRHFARECRSKGNQECVDWTGYAEDDTENYALMAINSSNSGSDTELTSCSKVCEESYAKLKKLYDEQREQLSDAIESKPKEVSEPKVWFDAPIIEEYESDSDDEYVFKALVEQEKPSCVFINTVKHVKNPRQTVKDQDTSSQNPKVPKRDWTGLMSKKLGLGYGYTRKACFVCGSFSHLIRDCDFHEKRMAKQVELNKRKIKLMLLEKKISQAASTSNVRKVNTARPIVNEIRPRNNVYKSHSPIRRPFNRTTAPKANFSNRKVNTVGDKTVIVVRGNHETAVKTSTGYNWRSKRDYWNKDTPHQTLKGKGIVDSGCSRYMTRNKDYLVEYQDFNGGPVAFGGSKGQITDTECIVLSPDFKLPNENQVLLRVPRQNNMYSFNLKNIVPSKYLACLIAKATVDESNKWHKIMTTPVLLVIKESNTRPPPDTVENKANKTTSLKEANNSAGTQDNIDARHSEIEVEHVQKYYVLPLWSSYTSTVKSSEANNGDEKLIEDTGSKKNDESVDQEDQAFLKELARLKRQEKEADDAAETLRKTFAKSTKDLLLQAGAARASSTNYVNTASTPVNTTSTLVNIASPSRDIPNLEDIYEVPTDEIFTNTSYDDEGAVADFTNLESTVNVSPIPQSRIHYIHPTTQILRDPNSAVKQGAKLTKVQEHMLLLNPKRYLKHLKMKVRLMIYRKSCCNLRLSKFRFWLTCLLGKRQEERIDYDEVFAHVARIEAIRIFLAFASYMGFIVYHMDVKSAFLYGKIDKEVYVSQPPGFIDSKFPKKKSWCDEFEALMKSRFQMSSMGELTFFLGLQVKQREDGIFISQDKYVAKILKKFNFMSVKTASTLIETKKPLVKDAEAADVDVHIYRSMIGSLMYLTASRPDIMYAVCACSRFQVTPKTLHLHAVKRIFRCLKGQPKLGLWYPRESAFNMEAYSDSDYAGTNLDKKSTIGGKSLYNMVAYLDKTEGNAQFHRIMDFLSRIHPFSKELASLKQTNLGKDFSNPLMADSLPKTIWLSMHHVNMDDPNITMEEYIRLEEEKARRRGKVYKWESATYALSYEPTVSSLNDEIDFGVSFDDSDDEDYTIQGESEQSHVSIPSLSPSWNIGIDKD